MMSERRLRDAYPDLLDEHGDPAMAKLIGDLDRLHTPPPPPQARVAVARALQERIAARRAAASTPGWRLPALLPRRLGIAATALLAALALAAAAAPALASLLDQVFALNPRAQRIDGQRLGRELNLSQTVNGFTVTIGRVYADANQIVIGYTVTGPAGRVLAAATLTDGEGWRVPVLTDARGRRLPAAPAMVQLALQGNQGSALLYYEGAGITSTPDALSLRLAAGGLRVSERLAGAGTPDRAAEDCGGQGCTYVVPGPWVFDFTVPFEPGRTTVLNQAAEVGGTTVTLERIVTTPAGTRVYLRGSGPNIYVDLIVDGVTYPLLFPGTGRLIPKEWTSDDTRYFQTPEPLGDKHGEWALVVRSGDRASALVAPEGGPWVFRFRVP